MIIQGAKPLYPGQNIYLKGSFKQIGSQNGLSLTTPIGDLYLTRYRVPTAGYQIALKVIGVSPGGHRTAPVFVSAVATQSTSADESKLTLK